MMMLYLLFGSPTAELFVASYNNTGKLNTITLNLETYGYKGNCGMGWLKPEDNHGIYNKSTSIHWWLASPDYYSGNYKLYVRGYYGSFDSSLGIDNDSHAVRPIVCIPTSVFNNKYATDTTLVDE